MAHEVNSNTPGGDPFERIDARDISDTSTRRRAARMVWEFMWKSRNYREWHLELALRSRKAYENWSHSGRSLTQRARLQLPFGFTVIETIVPQVVDIFIQDPQILKFEGRGVEDAAFEDSITDFHAHQMDEMNFEAKFPGIVKAMLLDGTVIIKTLYRFDERQVTRRQQFVDPVTGEQRTEKVQDAMVLFDGPDIETVPIYDFFPDWRVKQPGAITKMRGCVHRMYKTFSDLKMNRKRKSADGKEIGMYENLDELKVSLSSKGNKAWSRAFFDHDFKQTFERIDNNDSDRKDPNTLELWEYWGLFDPEGDGNFQEYLITIANGDVPIRMEINPFDLRFKPFIAVPNIPRENEFYGIPELIASTSLIKEANTLRNARLDNINLSVNPMWLVNRSAGINTRTVYSRPNGMVMTNDMEGLKAIQLPDPSAGSVQELSAIQADIQQATGLLSGPQLGELGRTFGRSATGVNFIQGFASSRIGLKARMLSNLFFKRLGWILLNMNRQFVDADKEIRVNGPDAQPVFQTLPQDAFFRKYDFQVLSDLETGGVEGQMQKVQTISQLLDVIERSQPGRTKLDVIAEATLRPLLGRTVARFMRTDEEFEALQQQQALQQQELNARIGKETPQPNQVAAQIGLPTTGEQ